MYKHNYIPGFGLIFLAEGRITSGEPAAQSTSRCAPDMSNRRNGRGVNFITESCFRPSGQNFLLPKVSFRRSYKITAVGLKWIYMCFESLPRGIIPLLPANSPTPTLDIVHSLPAACPGFSVFPYPVLS